MLRSIWARSLDAGRARPDPLVRLRARVCRRGVCMRSYRFARFDAERRLLDEVSVHCLNDEDALMVGSRMGWRVEVWDHHRPVGVTGEGAAEAPEMSPPP